MAGQAEHVKCRACGETVRDDRTKGGVCVNCLALGKAAKRTAEKD